MNHKKSMEADSRFQRIFDSKALRVFVRNRLYVLKMNYYMSEDDVINYVALCLIEALHEDKIINYPVAWAKTVSQRYIRKHRKKIYNSLPIESEHIDYLANLNSPQTICSEEANEVREKLNQLKLMSRKILWWRFFQCLSWKTIADLLTKEEGKIVSVTAARKRGERALDELRKAYQV